MKKNIAIGVFIGGNHIACAAVDLFKKEIIPNTYFKGLAENDSSSGLILMFWANNIKKSIDIVGKENIAGIGFSIPGPFDYENGIASFKGVPKYESLNGINIRNELSTRLKLTEDVEIRFVNDAIGFGLGEGWAGKIRRYQSCIAIMMGEGFGSAFIKNGVPVISGETVPLKGVVYNIPYRDSIADDYFSSRGVMNDYSSNGGVKFKKLKTLVDLSDKDKKISKQFNEFGINLAAFLAPIFNRFEAEVCVIGGELATCYKLYKDSFKSHLNKENCKITIEISDENDNSFILGGASLLIDEKWQKLAPIIPQLD